MVPEDYGGEGEKKNKGVREAKKLKVYFVTVPAGTWRIG